MVYAQSLNNKGVMAVMEYNENNEYSELYNVVKIVKHYISITKQEVPVSWDVIESVSQVIDYGANYRLFRKFLSYFMEKNEEIKNLNFAFVIERFKELLLVPTEGPFKLTDYNYDGFFEYIDKLIESGAFKLTQD